MREKRTIQRSVFEQYAEHEVGREQGAAARTPTELTIVPNKQLFTPMLLPGESKEGQLGLVAGNEQNE